jgi:hypothetical protein
MVKSKIYYVIKYNKEILSLTPYKECRLRRGLMNKVPGEIFGQETIT